MKDKYSNLDVVLLHIPKLFIYQKNFGLTNYINILPIGLYTIGSSLKQAGFKVEIVHLGIEIITGEIKNFIEYLKKSNVRIIGISLHWYYSIFDAVETAKIIKKYLPKIKIVFGGITASYFSEDLIRLSFVDFVIQGDGEKSFEILLNKLLRNSKNNYLPNVWRKDINGKVLAPNAFYFNTEEDFKKYDYAAFDLVKNKKYLPYFVIITVPYFTFLLSKLYFNRPFRRIYYNYLFKGCSMSCIYCGGNINVQKKIYNNVNIRAIPIKNFVDSMKKAISFGFTEIETTMGAGISENYLLELFSFVKKQNFKFRWTLWIGFLPSLKVIESFSNCTNKKNRIRFYLLSYSDRNRNKFGNKYITNTLVLNMLEQIKMRKIKIIVDLFFCYNLPFNKNALEYEFKEKQILKKNLKKYDFIDIYNEDLKIEPSCLNKEKISNQIKIEWNDFNDFYNAFTNIYVKNGFISSYNYLNKNISVHENLIIIFIYKIYRIIYNIEIRIYAFIMGIRLIPKNYKFKESLYSFLLTKPYNKKEK